MISQHMNLQSAVVVLVKFILVRMVFYYNICNKIEELKINFPCQVTLDNMLILKENQSGKI